MKIEYYHFQKKKKYNLFEKISPEKTDYNNNSIETINHNPNKNNSIIINKKQLKISSSQTKRNNYFKRKKNEIIIKPKNITIKNKNFYNQINKNKNNNKNKIIKDKKNSHTIENGKNISNISRNIMELSISNEIKINDSNEDNKSIKSINDSNSNNINKNIINTNYNDNNINNINKENKSILILESICKKGFAGPGIKKTNQDNFFIYNNFNNNPNYIYMGICDGHGMFGQGVSTYLVNNLPQNLNSILLNKNIKNLSTEDISLLTENVLSAFISTNEQLTQDDRIDSSFSGSTCVSLLYSPSRLICINVGDSRCILGKCVGEKWKAVNLSRDHKPDLPTEKERIEKNGGRVEPYKDNDGNYVGPDRVWVQGSDLPGLAMSRSFGDEVAHLVGVITIPEITEYYFCKEDKFIILGSDGLWEFINSEECVQIVKDFYLDKNIEGALTFLYKEASKRWILEEEIIDDITILIVFLKE